MAAWKKEQESIAYRVYVTDSLKAIAENTSANYGGWAPTKRYLDFIRPQKQDKRTGDEIAADVIQKAGLVVIPE